MARRGVFSQSIIPAGWWDESAAPEGWFADDAMGAETAVGFRSLALLGLGGAGAVAVGGGFVPAWAARSTVAWQGGAGCA